MYASRCALELAWANKTMRTQSPWFTLELDRARSVGQTTRRASSGIPTGRSPSAQDSSALHSSAQGQAHSRHLRSLDFQLDRVIRPLDTDHVAAGHEPVDLESPIVLR